ncbi:uridine/cytidine kinase [Coprinopsis cinerea okayama7|uniref:uridine/cytidine kinase n=1 Tax=Coprinopsis cinerea (strain Okayama-7 / 130 / ATCC MYA-4618 / FGSC 9003) TaxID=240176 RepID=A8NU41_COPC7|nr:uridine/cytidine kinase [Coprinopsis cinerea okayama7\|eukprot:XP_001836372.1 uridine/cytidine kinase [Coprinopsis cinerea okayama7\
MSSPSISPGVTKFSEQDREGHSAPWIQPKKNIVLTSHGRPPWYGEDGQRICDAFVIGIAGSIPTVIILSQASSGHFYKYHTPEELVLAHANKLDFDHPDALDMPIFASCLADLKAGKQSNIPIYSFSEHQRLEEKKYLYGASVIIAEGIMALVDPSLRALYDLKVFVQCDPDLMLARRIKRDVKERGRAVDGILDQYLRYVKPSYDNFVRPTAAHADIIVPGSNNAVAIDLMCTHIRQQLQERSKRFRGKIAIPHLYLPSKSGASTPESTIEDLDLHIMPQTRQIEGIFTILRDKDSSRQDFVFFADRLATLLVEHALQFLPYTPKTVVTPVGAEYDGQKQAAKYVCGVTIMRSGGALERGFRRVINDVPVGSLLVQSDFTTGDPLLLQVMLPQYVKLRHLAEETWVFLLDAQIGTAAAAFMAIRVLLDHGVKEDHIIFVTFLVARTGGVSVLRRAFPGVKIICGAVDEHMKEGWMEGYKGEGNPDGRGRAVWLMQPGMGQIGDRYYL